MTSMSQSSDQPLNQAHPAEQGHEPLHEHRFSLDEPALDVLFVVFHGHASSSLIASQQSASLHDGLDQYSSSAIFIDGTEAVPGGRAWWDQSSGPSQSTLEYIDAIVSDGVREFGDEPIVVAVGFSQGSAVAAEWACWSGRSTSIHALVMLSGFVSDSFDSQLSDPLAERTLVPVSMPVLVVSAEDDEVVDPFVSRRAAKLLRQLGATVEEADVSGGHVWSAEMNETAARWVRGLIAD